MDLGHNKLALHGRGTAYSRGDAERLLHRLVIEEILAEELRTTAADTTACYIMLGSKAADLMHDKIKVVVHTSKLLCAHCHLSLC